MLDHISKHLKESWEYTYWLEVLGNFFDVYVNIVKHSLECLIYLLNQNQN